MKKLALLAVFLLVSSIAHAQYVPIPDEVSTAGCGSSNPSACSGYKVRADINARFSGLVGISPTLIAGTVLPNTAVTPGSYTNANITVGADGRITAASNGGGSIVSGTTGYLSYYTSSTTLGQIGANTVHGTVVAEGSSAPTIIAPGATGTVYYGQTSADPIWTNSPALSGANFTASSLPTNVLATVQGNGSKVQLSTSTTTTNDCVKFDANGNTVDSGAGCGTGTGSVTNIATTSPISGGPITTTGTISLLQVPTNLGGLNTTTNPTSAQIPIAQGTTNYLPETISGAGDLGTTTLNTSGVLNAQVTNGSHITNASIPKSGLAYSTQPYEIHIPIGSPTASQKWYDVCEQSVTFPVNFATTPFNSQFICPGSNPSETDVYTFKVNGSTIGQVSVTSSCVPTFTTTGGTTQTCTAGQPIEIDAPATVSGTGIVLGLAGTRAL